MTVLLSVLHIKNNRSIEHITRLQSRPREDLYKSFTKIILDYFLIP